MAASEWWIQYWFQGGAAGRALQASQQLALQQGSSSEQGCLGIVLSLFSEAHFSYWGWCPKHSDVCTLGAPERMLLPGPRGHGLGWASPAVGVLIEALNHKERRKKGIFRGSLWKICRDRSRAMQNKGGTLEAVVTWAAEGNCHWKPGCVRET